MTQSGREGLMAFWEVYDARREQVTEGIREVAAGHPEFASLMKSLTPEQRAEQDRRSRELQRRAVVSGEWEPYLSDLRQQGELYAQTGISFPAWFDLLSAFRSRVLPHLITAYGSTPDRLSAAVNGMDDFVDKAMAAIGEAYLTAKERLISRQQEALRDLSTPVLQARDGLLILPIVGMIDTQRARQLTEQLLRAIRANRARVVVLDITGVPAVDTKVANHLAQTVEAARLMGAHAIVTGLSAEVAQTLVTLGIDLSKLRTVGDLQGGFEEANRLLGYAIMKQDAAGR